MSALRKLARRSVFVAVALIAAAIAWVWCDTEQQHVNDAYEVRETDGHAISVTAFQAILSRLDKQKDERSSWAYTLLAGIVAITVLKRVIPIPAIRSAYSLLPMAGVFIVQSIRAADYYERAVTAHLISTSVEFGALAGMEDMLWLQITFLDRALLVLALFVSLFLIAIISGSISLATTANLQPETSVNEAENDEE